MPARSTLRLKAMSAEEQLRDTNLRRIRGELSCAECRRLKLRCDKKSPCSSCVRRGCESICPCGAFEPWSGSRYIVASTTQLHTKISAMSSRIRSLEDGLAIIQSSITDEPHPLLEEHLLKIKFDVEITNHDEPGGSNGSGSGSKTSEGDAGGSGGVDTVNVDVSSLNTLGTLTIGEDGEAYYFGRSAGGETLILAGSDYVGSDCSSNIGDPEDVEDGMMSSMTITRHSHSNKPLIDPSDEHVGEGVKHPLDDPPQTSAFWQETADAHAIPLSDDVQVKDSELGKVYTVPPELYALAEGSSGFRGPMYSGTAVPDLLKHLPTPSRAESLVNSYFNHAALFFRPMKKNEVFSVVLPMVYPRHISMDVEGDIEPIDATEGEDASSKSDSMLPSPHLLASVFFIFALGAYYDISLSAPSYASEAEMWYGLGRKALVAPIAPYHLAHDPGSNKDKVLPHEPGNTAVPMSLPHETVQALGLMGTYFSAVGEKRSRESAWCCISLAVKIAEGAGLHRDPARWKMDPQTVQKRRTLWWEIVFSDARDSTALGRPPSTHLGFADCEFPTDEEASLDTDGEVMVGPWRLKYNCTKEIFRSIIETTLKAKLPSYETILDVDRKIRQFKVPAYFKSATVSEDEDDPNYHDPVLSLRDFWGSQLTNFLMLYLHRSFFVHAVSAFPSNPMASPFAPSFLATYRAANELIKASMTLSNRCNKIAGRSWFLLYHIFSAAVAVGTVAQNSPGANIAASALMDLSLAVDFFEKCAQESYRNKVAFLILRKLKDKALRSYTKFLATRGNPVDKKLDINLFTKKNEEDADELALFGGTAPVVQKSNTKTKHRRKSLMDEANGGQNRSRQHSPASSGSASSPGSPESSMPPDSISNVPQGGVEYNVLAQMSAAMQPPYEAADAFPSDVIVNMDLQDALTFGDTNMGPRIEELAPMGFQHTGVPDNSSRPSSEGVHPSLSDFLNGIDPELKQGSSLTSDWSSSTPSSNFTATTESWSNTTTPSLPTSPSAVPLSSPVLPGDLSSEELTELYAHISSFIAQKRAGASPSIPSASPPSLQGVNYPFQPFGSPTLTSFASSMSPGGSVFPSSPPRAAEDDRPQGFYEWFIRDERR